MVYLEVKGSGGKKGHGKRNLTHQTKAAKIHNYFNEGVRWE